MQSESNFFADFTENLELAETVLEEAGFEPIGFSTYLTQHEYDVRHLKDDPEDALNDLLNELEKKEDVRFNIDGEHVVNLIDGKSDGIENITDELYHHIRGEVLIEEYEERERPTFIQYIPDSSGGQFKIRPFGEYEEPLVQEARAALEKVDRPVNIEY